MNNDFEEYYMDLRLGHVEDLNGPDEHGIYPSHMSWSLKASKPYSYEPFYVFKSSGKVNGSVYSDRMQQWDYDKYKASAEKTDFKGYTKDPETVEAFLRAYFDEPELKLVRVIEYCNVSNGYPCWRVDYYTPEDKG